MGEPLKPARRRPGEKVWCERGGVLVIQIPDRACMMGYQYWLVRGHDGAYFVECEDRLRDVLRAKGECDE